MDERIEQLERRVTELESALTRLIVTSKAEGCPQCHGDGVQQNDNWRAFDDGMLGSPEYPRYYEDFQRQNGPPEWPCSECEGEGRLVTTVAVVA